MTFTAIFFFSEDIMYRKTFAFMLLGIATAMIGCSDNAEENAAGNSAVSANQVKLNVTGMT
tara:strand:+ start:51 stop:233 length:183 start_codon:yes stop_codon:yes gene_type:complete